MATLVLSAVGTAFGGPLGGAVGSLLGSQIDGAIFGSSDREGPRLRELSVTTSSYGTAIPRHFGTMRSAGSIIWATELVESSEEAGGSKGQPSVTTYSYAISFAVALSSRPIANIGRIWADGNLLRGEASDLKVGGSFRFYDGRGDQAPDPLIMAQHGAACPAFRGMAYCVFEDLQLADFGNRIPALSFEIIADEDEVTLEAILEAGSARHRVDRSLSGLQGYSDTGGPLQSTLDAVGQVYPLTCDASASTLSFFDSHPSGAPLALLPEPAADVSGESFGSATGRSSQRRADGSRVPGGLRYYDIARDYQAGLQRPEGRARTGRNNIMEFPGALAASRARKLANDAAERAGLSQERLAYRIAQLDPALGPGQVVRVPGKSGKWRIETWEWRENGLELDLLRIPHRPAAEHPTDAGAALPPRDAVAGPTTLRAYELPWDGLGSPDQRLVFAAVSSASSGWTGATLYTERNGTLVPFAGSGNRRSVAGKTVTFLNPSAALFIDRQAVLDVTLDSPDFELSSATPEAIADGANRALVGEEILQFCTAENLGPGVWRLAGLLRGRGGTEPAATVGSPAGVDFVLLDQKPVFVPSEEVGQSEVLAAIGLADSAAVVAPIIALGRSRRPLAPVHGKCARQSDGSLELRWRRRARGCWRWDGTVDVPLNEQLERYEVALGNPERPERSWMTSETAFTIDSLAMEQLKADFSGQSVWVRQVGTHARSQPLFLTTII